MPCRSADELASEPISCFNASYDVVRQTVRSTMLDPVQVNDRVVGHLQIPSVQFAVRIRSVKSFQAKVESLDWGAASTDLSCRVGPPLKISPAHTTIGVPNWDASSDALLSLQDQSPVT